MDDQNVRQTVCNETNSCVHQVKIDGAKVEALLVRRLAAKQARKFGLNLFPNARVQTELIVLFHPI